MYLRLFRVLYPLYPNNTYIKQAASNLSDKTKTNSNNYESCGNNKQKMPKL